MPEERPVYYNAKARSRINATVRDREAGVFARAGEIEGPIFPQFNIKLGKADADIAKGASGTVSEYAGTTAGSESDTGTNWTAYNRFGAITSGKWVIIARFMGVWHIIQAEC